MTNRLIQVSSIAAVVAAVTLSATALVPSLARAQTTPPADARRTVTVVGLGRASATPDIARVTVGVDIVKPQLANALTEVNTKTSAIIAALKKAGVADADIRTLDFNVFPQQAYGPAGPGPITGYRVSNAVRVTVRDLSKAGAVLDAAVGAGANTVNNLTFTVENDQTVQADARTNAIKDAKAKAEALAAEAGAAVGQVMTISEIVIGGPSPVMQNAASGIGAGGGGVELAPGMQDISVQVQVTYELQ